MLCQTRLCGGGGGGEGGGGGGGVMHTPSAI